MPIAYSYIRFSSEKQKKGASIQRQEELATKFIKDNPELELDLDTALNMRDLGVSAFKGKNMTDGALGNFTALVYQGKIEQGSFLLLENLDRFSRDEAWIAVNDLIDGVGGPGASAHFQGGVGDGERHTFTPVACGIHPEPFRAEVFENIDGAGGGTFADRIQGHARPESRFTHDADGVFFHMINDDPARVDAGLGCIPRVAFNGAPIYERRLRREEAERRLDQVYRPYHRALDALLRRAQAMFGQAWLVDCHSMPAETEAQGRSPDIVIGDRFGASCAPGLADLVEHLFRSRGYTTARNSPYAGGFATLAHGQPGLGRHALQIEVRRRLYLDEANVEPHDGFLSLRHDLREISAEICAFARAQVGLEPGDTKKKAALDTSAAKGLGRKRP